MYGVGKQMSQYSSYEQASAPVGQSNEISPEVREVLHMLEVIGHKQPAVAAKR